jgi:asparagine synthase (glutamine-hydrolysing)
MGLSAMRREWDSALYEAVTAPYRRCGARAPVQRAQYADLSVYLPNDVLVKVDRMSMAHGLEVRSPMLDRRVVELGFSFPESLKRVGRRGKHLLRRLAADRLPSAVVTAPKHGFSAPVGDWISGPYRGAYQDEVMIRGSRVSALLDMTHVRQLFQEHTEGRADRSFPLWAVWMLERWMRRTGQTAAVGTNRPRSDVAPAQPLS